MACPYHEGPVHPLRPAEPGSFFARDNGCTCLLTEVPDWPGMTHYLNIHTATLEQFDDPGIQVAVAAALRRLERQNPGKTYKMIGRHYCQRMDVLNNPWQLFIGLQEVVS